MPIPSRTCDNLFNFQKRPRLKRCGCICIKYMFDTPHILVVRGAQSHIWSLPKGCIKDGESEKECAIRETHEETGLTINLPDTSIRISINHNVYFVVHLDQHEKFNIVDKCEIDKVHWMTLDECKHVVCNKDLRSILQYPEKKFHFHHLLFQQINKDVQEHTSLAFETSQAC